MGVSGGREGAVGGLVGLMCEKMCVLCAEEGVTNVQRVPGIWIGLSMSAESEGCVGGVVRLGAEVSHVMDVV